MKRKQIGASVVYHENGVEKKQQNEIEMPECNNNRAKNKKKLATEIALKQSRFEARPMFRVIVTMAFFGVTLLVLLVLPFESNDFFVPWFQGQITGFTVFETLAAIGLLLGIYGVGEFASLYLRGRVTLVGALMYVLIILAICSFLIVCLKTGEMSIGLTVN